uniref:Late blight resistance protein n=1 Tax=Solanum tuberosum TaxID=4113 RepID=M1DDI1_SOLTU
MKNRGAGDPGALLANAMRRSTGVVRSDEPSRVNISKRASVSTTHSAHQSHNASTHVAPQSGYTISTPTVEKELGRPVAVAEMFKVTHVKKSTNPTVSSHTRTFHVLMPVDLHLMTMQTQVPRISIQHAVDTVEHSRRHYPLDQWLHELVSIEVPRLMVGSQLSVSLQPFPLSSSAIFFLSDSLFPAEVAVQ